MVKIKQRHRLKNKQIRMFEQEIQKKFPDIVFSDQVVIESGIIENIEIFIVDNSIDFFKSKDAVFFTLPGLYKFSPSRYRVVVDMGAVRFVVNGADVMVPGIVDADECIEKDDFVWVCDVNNKKPLAVGVALLSGVEMKQNNLGKAINTIHYVGDKLWNSIKG